MKSLTKAKLINWHYFWNQTIDFQQIVFLTGENGAGKSTIVDALMLVLLGDTTGKYFNKAAMDKSNRTLKGYLRGEVADTLEGDFKYLRNGVFTSYIALEFYDDVHNSYFTMGIVFDTLADGSDERHFFSYEGPFFENEFIKDRIPMNYKTLHAYLNEYYSGKFTFYDSNKQYQEALKLKFGGLKQKYFSLLKKASSFKPIDDITTFITDYVCDPQEDINLTHLQDNIFQYRKLQNEAKEVEARVSVLEDIKEKFNIYDNQRKRFKIDSYVIDRCKLENLKYNLDALKNELSESKKRIKEIDQELKENKANLEELNARKVNYIADKNSNDTVKLASRLTVDKSETEKKIATIEEEINSIKNNLLRYANNFIKSSSSIIEKLKNFDKSFLDEDKEKELNELQNLALIVLEESNAFKEIYINDLSQINSEVLTEYRKNLNNFKDYISSLAMSLARSITSLDRKINNLRSEEEGVKEGNKYYDPILTRIRDTIAEELKNKYGKVIPVEIYADLVDIDDKSWSNAIEGFLNQNKFNLFVPPKYYYDAYRVLRLLLEERYFPTSLVDQEKIIEKNYGCDENSLASEIITDHEGARAYTNFLIGNLYKANSIEECRESGNGITKECDLYRNYSLTRINPRLYQNSYIGRRVDARFIKEKTLELQKSIANKGNYKALHDVIDSANSCEVMTSFEISTMISGIEKSAEIIGLKSHLEYLNNELKSKNTDLIRSIDNKIKRIDEDISNLNDSSTQLSEEKGGLNARIKEIEKEKIIKLNEDIATKNLEIANAYDPDFIASSGEPALEKELETGKDYMEIIRDYSAEYSRIQYTLSNYLKELVNARESYIKQYHLSYDINSHTNEQFDEDYHEYKEVRLPQYQMQIEDSYHKAVAQFKNDFINKLREAIVDVEYQIEELNDALKLATFGNDSYRFTVKPSTTYRRYYDMLKDDMFLDSDLDEGEFLDKYKDIMEDLFKQIVDTGSEKNSELVANIEKFTDYRAYLEFDLIVTNRTTNEVKRLSRMMRKSSGGETQTPFYISVLASFAQLYHVKDKGEMGNTVRLIIFDEAFSKMDPRRVVESVKLLKEFDLQVILTAPTGLISDIAEYVDETIVASRDKNVSVALSFSKTDKIDLNNINK